MSALKSIPSPLPGQGGTFHGRLVGGDGATANEAAAWFVPVDVARLDARNSTLSLAARMTLVHLDGFARLETWCFPRVATLAAAVGVSPRQLQIVFKELEDAECVERVHDARGTRGYLLGIILRRRLAESMPAADTPKRLEAARKAILKRQDRPRKGKRPGKPGKPENADSGTLEEPQTAIDCRLDPLSERKPCALTGIQSANPALSERKSCALQSADSAPEEEALELDALNNDRSLASERFSEGEKEPQKPEPKPDPLAVADEIHRRLYAGMSDSIRERDWAQWQDRFTAIGRDLIAGRITQADVDAALDVARKGTTNKRGARFTGQIVKAMERRARTDATPTPTPTPPPAPAPPPPPASPRQYFDAAEYRAKLAREEAARETPPAAAPLAFRIDNRAMAEAEYVDAVQDECEAWEAAEAERKRRDAEDRARRNYERAEAEEAYRLHAEAEAKKLALQAAHDAAWDKLGPEGQAAEVKAFRDSDPIVAKEPDMVLRPFVKAAFIKRLTAPAEGGAA